MAFPPHSQKSKLLPKMLEEKKPRHYSLFILCLDTWVLSTVLHWDAVPTISVQLTLYSKENWLQLFGGLRSCTVLLCGRVLDGAFTAKVKQDCATSCTKKGTVFIFLLQKVNPRTEWVQQENELPKDFPYNIWNVWVREINFICQGRWKAGEWKDTRELHLSCYCRANFNHVTARYPKPSLS